MSQVQVGELEQRIMVFSRAFQDLIEAIMKERQQIEVLKRELGNLRRELSELQKETKKSRHK